MIFVTVGTHEQPFDRLVKAIDQLIEKEIIQEDVFIQRGYSLYKPRLCESAEFISFSEMRTRIEEARIVVTHGGGSVMLIIHAGKVPIVVPRLKKFDEHVDNNQFYFAKKLEEKAKIIAIYDLEEIEEKIGNYDRLVRELRKYAILEMDPKEKISHFIRALESICLKLAGK